MASLLMHHSLHQWMYVLRWIIMCVCVTDAKQKPLSLIITPIKGTIGFLKRRGLLCKAFSVHLKHQPTAKLSITEAIRHVERLHRYLEEANKWILDQLDKLCKPTSQHGTISHQTISSVSMILRPGLKDLHKFLDNLNPAFTVDLHMCLTVQVENLHAMSHFKLFKDRLAVSTQHCL